MVDFPFFLLPLLNGNLKLTTFISRRVCIRAALFLFQHTYEWLVFKLWRVIYLNLDRWLGASWFDASVSKSRMHFALELNWGRPPSRWRHSSRIKVKSNWHKTPCTIALLPERNSLTQAQRCLLKLNPPARKYVYKVSQPASHLGEPCFTYSYHCRIALSLS